METSQSSVMKIWTGFGETNTDNESGENAMNLTGSSKSESGNQLANHTGGFLCFTMEFCESTLMEYLITLVGNYLFADNHM